MQALGRPDYEDAQDAASLWGDVMTNGIALVLALMVIGIFALDAMLLHWNLPLLVGRQMLSLIEWFSFWR